MTTCTARPAGHRALVGAVRVAVHRERAEQCEHHGDARRARSVDSSLLPRSSSLEPVGTPIEERRRVPAVPSRPGPRADYLFRPILSPRSLNQVLSWLPKNVDAGGDHDRR